VQEIRIFSDTSGVTLSRGGSSIITASAGYLTSTIFGAVLLLFGRNSKYSKAVLFFVTILILALTFFFMKNLFGWGVGLVMVAFLGLIAHFGSPRFAHFFLNFLAVQCCLNALYDLRVLFEISATTREASDAMNMQKLTFIPAVVWAVLWLLLSAIVLWIALKQYFKVREKDEENENEI
jgi:hypothetical protein